MNLSISCSVTLMLFSQVEDGGREETLKVHNVSQRQRTQEPQNIPESKPLVLSLIRLFFGLFISHLFFLYVISTRGWQFVLSKA